MRIHSTVDWFTPPAPRPASYLPPPYGGRRGAVLAFVRSAKAEIHLATGVSTPSSKRFGMKRRVWRAVDFGHDNLAWSRSRTRHGGGRIALTAVCSALFGAAIAVWFGTSLPDAVALSKKAAFSSALPGGQGAGVVHGDRADTLALRASGEVAVAGAHTDSNEQHTRTGKLLASEPLRQAGVREQRESGRSVVLPDDRRPRAHQRKAAPGESKRAVARPVRPASVALAVPAPESAHECEGEWLCGENLQAARIELANHEAARGRQQATRGYSPGNAIHFREHTRLTDS